jgi:phosphohistidine swiveling domain-containing protein
VTRFRQLLSSSDSLLSLADDAAEKQGGGFILDRQYAVALAEQVAELAESVAFDLNVLTAQGNLPFYKEVERLRSELRGLFAEEAAAAPAGEAVTKAAAVSPATLAAALARTPILYRGCGQVARSGVASGPVVHFLAGMEPGSIPPGSILVAGDLFAEDRIPEVLLRVGAVLLDRGSAAGSAARLARELRIPAIVGLGDATSRLSGVQEVTVDADENVVYQGRVAELLDYYLATRLAAEEEPEYALLRSVRRIAFPLTFQADGAGPALGDCRTIRDVVHLASSRACDAMAALLATCGRDAGTVERIAGAPWCRMVVTRLDHLPGRDPKGGAAPAEPPSRPLHSFLEGLALGAGSAGDGGSSAPLCVLEAAATDEQVLLAITSPVGFDMLDAAAGETWEANTIFCRFAPRGENDPEAFRGALAAGVLSRLGFAVAVTGHETSGFGRGLSSEETGECIRILGGLFARLARPGDAGRGRADVEPAVDAFLKEPHVRRGPEAG